MSRLFIGHKPGVGGVVKVMKNNGDDPITTPNTDYSKFLFNSETGKIGYVIDFDEVSYNWNYDGQHGLFYEPSGSNINTCTHVYFHYNSIGNAGIFFNRILGKNYPLIADQRKQAPLGGRVPGPKVFYRQTANGFDGYVGYNYGDPTYAMLLNRQFDTLPGFVWTAKAEAAWISYGRNNASSKTTVIVYDLPGDETPMPAGTPAASGSRNLLINATTVKIAKGKASIDSGNPDDLIIDSDRVPLKIIRGGRQNMSPWQTIDLFTPGHTLTPRTYVDFMVWENGGPTTIPQWVGSYNVNSQNFRFEYEIHHNRVRLVNNGDKHLTVTYVITGEGGNRTTGGSKVFETLPDGNVRIKRPGSSDVAPTDSDVLLDTRLPYMPVVQEGYLDISQFNEPPINKSYGDRGKTINFHNDGFIPFLKYYVKRLDRQGNFYMVTHPWTKTLRVGGLYDPNGFNGMQASDGTVAQLGSNHVKFHLAAGHPWELDMSSTPERPKPVYSNFNKAVGIRYFVFAIPTNL